MSSTLQESHFIYDLTFQYEKQKEEEKYKVFRNDLISLFMSEIEQNK
jgi:hypothetical protein